VIPKNVLDSQFAVTEYEAPELYTMDSRAALDHSAAAFWIACSTAACCPDKPIELASEGATLK